MTAPVEQVKSAAAQAVADNPDADVRTLTIKAFEAIYKRHYDSRHDTTEYARIKWHVQRVGYVGPGRGGNRGGGRPKGTSTTHRTTPESPHVIRTVPAWQLIGWDNGAIRVHGGTATYESCDGNATSGTVLLQRLETSGRWPKPIRRTVPADTLIDVLEEINPPTDA